MANKKDLANGLIGAALTSAATTLVLQAGYGNSMPAVPFFLTITPAGQLSTRGNSEIVNVTARTGDTLTITRAQKGTTARSFSAGDIVSNSIYADASFDSLDVAGDIYSNGKKVLDEDSVIPSSNVDLASLIRSAHVGHAGVSYNNTETLLVSLDVTDLRIGGIITVSLLAFGWTNTVANEGISARIATNLGTIVTPYGNRTDPNKMLSFSISFPKTSGMTTVSLYIKTQIGGFSIERSASIIAI